MLETSPAAPTQESAPAWHERLVERLAFVDTPRRAAGAFALGVFLSFSPFLGLQVALGLGTALALRLSRIAVFAGLCMNLPWFMVPWYTMTTFGAAMVLGTPISPDFGAALGRVLELPVYDAVFWTEAGRLLAPLLWSFLLGSTAGAALIGVISYLSAVRAFARAQVRAVPR